MVPPFLLGLILFLATGVFYATHIVCGRTIHLSDFFDGIKVNGGAARLMVANIAVGLSVLNVTSYLACSRQ